MLKTVRMLFEKRGRAKYISHLDLNRTMIRAVRRAGIPIWYTEGFNRHPYITFAAPLSLGFESVGELIELKLTEDMPLDEVTAHMNAAMPEGLRVVETFEAVKKVRELHSAEYEITFSCAAETVCNLLAQTEILVEKKTKKKEFKTIDIRPAFDNATVTPYENGCKMAVTLPCNSENTVNPILFVTALAACVNTSFVAQVLRLRLLDADGNVFR